MKNAKYKIILILAVLIFVVISINTSYNLYHEYQESERRLSEAHAHVQRTYNETLKEVIAFYHSRAEANLRSPGVMEAFKAKDHDRLYELIRPRWGVMQRENPWLTVMQFHNADGTSLLRVHQSNVYGDRIADQRPMVAHAHSTQQSIAGFEEGRKGLAYRILVPAFDRGVYIGSVEFGVAAPYFTDKIRRFAGYDSFFFIKKAMLGKFGRIEEPVEIGEYVGVSIDPNYRKLIDHYGSRHLTLENAVLPYRNRTYEINTLNVNDYLAQPIGAIMFIRLSDDFKTHARHMIVATGVIGLILMAIIALIVDRVYSYVTLKMSFQERYSQMILDSVPSPVIVTDGEHLIAANSSFLGYFNYESVMAFKRDHQCVCEYFEPGETDEYLMPMIDDQRWTEYMLLHPLKIHKAKITLGHVTTIFEVRISVLKVSDDTRYVVIFNDISTMQRQTMTDPLTQIPNRFHFTMVFDHIIQVAKRGEKPLSIVFFDIDHFKDVNDRYGHLVGDTVLKEIATMVSQRIRRSDIVARWGGEEFVLLLPDTDLDEAVRVADMLKNGLNDKDFDHIGNITCSFGVAVLEANEDAQHFLSRADQLLYEAKNTGRNKVVY